MNKSVLLIITIILFLVGAAFGESLSETSANGLFKVEMLLKGKNLQVGRNGVELTVRDGEGKEVPGARIFVLPYIHQHGESTIVRPSVSEREKGRYSVENLFIEIPGHWVVKVTITKDGLQDSVLFDFPEVKKKGV